MNDGFNKALYIVRTSSKGSLDIEALYLVFLSRRILFVSCFTAPKSFYCFECVPHRVAVNYNEQYLVIIRTNALLSSI